MSEPTATIRYEQPAIVGRDLVAGLLDAVKSDAGNDNGNGNGDPG